MGLHLLIAYQPDERYGDSEGGALGGFIGMSGGLPFAKDIQDLIRPRMKKTHDEADDDDIFAISDGKDGFKFEFDTESPQRPPEIQVCNFVRENMDMPPLAGRKPSYLQTPVFLGHGKSDEKVEIGLGREAARLLKGVGLQVRWEEYDEGHRCKVPEQIDDLVSFLKAASEFVTYVSIPKLKE